MVKMLNQSNSLMKMTSKNELTVFMKFNFKFNMEEVRKNIN